MWPLLLCNLITFRADWQQDENTLSSKRRPPLLKKTSSWHQMVPQVFFFVFGSQVLAWLKACVVSQSPTKAMAKSSEAIRKVFEELAHAKSELRAQAAELDRKQSGTFLTFREDRTW